MSTLQASSFLCSSFSCSSKNCPRGISTTRAAMNIPKLALSSLSLPNLKSKGFVEELEFIKGGYTNTLTGEDSPLSNSSYTSNISNVSDPIVIAKLYAIMEAVADRVEMHKNICEQRNNWNSLLLTSINAITLAAATFAGIAATSAVGSPVLGLNLSSSLLYVAATGMLIIMNKIQPSQLAEEQRNATRLFKQLHSQIQTLIADETKVRGAYLSFQRKEDLKLSEIGHNGIFAISWSKSSA